ncbi:MAG TPA: sigma-70 family RNA polymerase sigma factor [Chitinophagaceae bacterium]|nr:sigma-70 family RNA polymerase sigma factor [Chitinophagaceae bacterium]
MDTLTNESIEQLYREAFLVVAKTVARLGGGLDAAKDIFHDALIIYLEKEREPAFKIQGSPAAYLTGIARILWIRKFNHECRLISIGGPAEGLPVPEDLFPLEDSRPARLLTYLESIGKKCLELLQAFYYEQRSMQEIAETFHYKTRHSASVQKHKCLEKVREELKTSSVYEEAIA